MPTCRHLWPVHSRRRIDALSARFTIVTGMLLALSFLFAAAASLEGQGTVLHYPRADSIDAALLGGFSELDQGTGYRYEFTVSSSSKSVQDVWTAAVSVPSSGVQQIAEPSGWADAFPLSDHPSQPGRALLGWAGVDYNQWVKPGQDLSGFSFESGRLPGVVSYRLQGYVLPPMVPVDQEPDTVVGYKLTENSLAGSTIGPTKEGTSDPAIELRNVHNNLNLMCTLEWFTSHNCSQLQDLATEAETDLAAYDNSGAIATINSLISVLNGLTSPYPSVQSQGAIAALVYLADQVVLPLIPKLPDIGGGKSSGCTKLLAGRTINVGTVCIDLKDKNVTVTYKTTSPWVLDAVHFDVERSLEAFPQNKKGNPEPGHFEVQDTTLGGVETFGRTLALSSIPATEGDTLYVAAHAVVASGSDTATAWGAGNRFPGKNWATYFTFSVPVLTPIFAWKEVSPGRDSDCGVLTDGQVYCWGENTAGQLGAGEVDNFGYIQPASSTVPLKVQVTSGIEEVSVGGAFACGLTTTGQAYCWGTNHYGQLGRSEVGSIDQINVVPGPVATNLHFAQLDVGKANACALDESGHAYCWGANYRGEVGDGTYGDPVSVPTAVSGNLVFKQISTGSGSSCGIDASGAAYCWGDNHYGQLGNGTHGDPSLPATIGPNSQSAVPVPVSGGLVFRTISVGGSWACGVTEEGSAYCWGSETFGALGNGTDGTNALSDVPVPVAGSHNFATVNAGSGLTCGLDTSGAALCWGYNGNGQLGNGTSGSWTWSDVPVYVVGGLLFKSIAPDGDAVCAITLGSDTYCWGSDFYGQLGQGGFTGGFSDTPVKVVDPNSQ